MSSANPPQASNRASSGPVPLRPLDDAQIVFVMPVAPKTKAASILDTADSMRHNLREAALIIGIEDGSEDLYSALEPHATDFTLVRVELPSRGDDKGYRTKGKLFLKTSALFQHALRYSPAKVVCRIDDDILVIRPGFEDDIKRLLERNPKCGGFGTVRWGFEGPVRPFPKRRGLFESTVLWFIFPLVARTMAPLIFGAFLRGNPLGIIVAGMCACYTRDCLEAIESTGLFDKTALMRSQSPDDLIMSCAALCAGFELCDFPREGNPLGFQWKILPASPERLWNSGVKIVHSVRDQEYGTEEEIRRYFRERYSGLGDD